MQVKSSNEMKNKTGSEIGYKKMVIAKQDRKGCMNHTATVQRIQKTRQSSFNISQFKLQQERKDAYGWIKDCNSEENNLANIQVKVLMLVASLKENDNYKRMEEETFITGKGQFHCFKSWHNLINIKLSFEVGRAEKDAAMAFVPRFQGLVKASGYDNPYFIWMKVFMMKG